MKRASMILVISIIFLCLTGSSVSHALYNPGFLYRQGPNPIPEYPTSCPEEFEQHSHIPILMYHEVGEPFTDYEDLFVATEDFRKHMEYLVDNGYNTVSMSDVAAHWQRDQPLPSNPIVITFDDGYRGNYTNAFPIMEELGLTGTIYMVEEFVGRDRHLTEEMLSEMIGAGFELGNHTATHADLTEVSGEQLLKEVKHSNENLQERFEVYIETFAYPFGRYNDETLKALEDADFKTGVTVESGLASWRQDLLQLRRIAVLRRHGPSGMEEILLDVESEGE